MLLKSLPRGMGAIFVACISASASVFLITLIYACSTKKSTQILPKYGIQIKRSDSKLINHTLRLPTLCANETCRSDYARHLQVMDVHPIPAIRHILWRNESVSAYFAEQLRSWQRIHPDWTFVLWRDRDLESFVTTHFPGLLAKFKSLPRHIMRVDMIRYMLLFKYGGVYADLDYSLAQSLNDFRHFHAVVTREPESHSLEFLPISWPIKVLASPAFMMSAPGHIFFHFMMYNLESRYGNSDLTFAGPFGLTEILERFASKFPIATHALETVYVPPSRSFYPYDDNRLNNSHSAYLGLRYSRLKGACQKVPQTDPQQQRWKPVHPLRQYCADVDNLDPITDRSQPVFAVHDLNKAGAAYDGAWNKLFHVNLTDARHEFPTLKLGNDFMQSG